MEKLLRQYFELLIKWNQRINLTSIKTEQDFRHKHVDDSLSILPYLGDAKTILDIGTGAGIPGIILKIARPDLDVTLLDSTRKKISFCDEVIRSLKLRGIRAVWGRVEDDRMSKKLGDFDVVISRATWRLSEFLDVASRYMARKGRCIAMKGSQWETELKEAMLKKPALVLEGEHHYLLHGGEERCLLIFFVTTIELVS